MPASLLSLFVTSYAEPRHWHAIRLRIVEELAWQNGSRFYLLIYSIGTNSSMARVSDRELVSSFLTAASRLAYARIQAICQNLASDFEDIPADPRFPVRCAGAKHSAMLCLVCVALSCCLSFSLLLALIRILTWSLSKSSQLADTTQGLILRTADPHGIG